MYMDEQLKLKRPQEGFFSPHKLSKNNGSDYSEPKASSVFVNSKKK